VIYQDPLAYLLGLEGIALLDAWTGRFAEFLARRGHQVIGVDSSPDMLAHARRRVPDGEFHLGALDRLPLADDSADVIVCALALVHVPDLQRVLAEFARVLRPGGDLVISDLHHELTTLGS
jgi:ubiquinone/menaquinone biosynthesis C-methylase UbiE